MKKLLNSENKKTPYTLSNIVSKKKLIKINDIKAKNNTSLVLIALKVLSSIKNKNASKQNIPPDITNVIN